LPAHGGDNFVCHFRDGGDLPIGSFWRRLQQLGDQFAFLFGSETGGFWASARNPGIRIARRERRRRGLDGGLLLRRA